MLDKYIILPSHENGVDMPRFKDGDKVPCVLATYNRGVPSHTHDRPYVLEVNFEESGDGY